jgi:hypothetical protein
MNDDQPVWRRWRLVHHLVWEATHGPIPVGYVLTCRQGRRHDPRLEDLELVSRREWIQRYSVHHLPPALKTTVFALGRLRQVIRQRERAR